jgi:hypothetical protein
LCWPDFHLRLRVVQSSRAVGGAGSWWRGRIPLWGRTVRGHDECRTVRA